MTVRKTWVAGWIIAFAGMPLNAFADIAPDNSGVNRSILDQGKATAQDQARASRSDTEVTREIRRAITQDPAFSTYAKNVKIIVNSAGVIVKGPVRSDDEKARIVAIAQKTAPHKALHDEMTVTP